LNEGPLENIPVTYIPDCLAQSPRGLSSSPTPVNDPSEFTLAINRGATSSPDLQDISLATSPSQSTSKLITEDNDIGVKPPSQWSCTTCLVPNNPDCTHCIACNAKNPSKEPQSYTNSLEGSKEASALASFVETKSNSGGFSLGSLSQPFLQLVVAYHRLITMLSPPLKPLVFQLFPLEASTSQLIHPLKALVSQLLPVEASTSQLIHQLKALVFQLLPLEALNSQLIHSNLFP